jgi:hypothetical protein
MFTSGIGEPQSTPYRVMARDAASTVVEWFDETAGSNRLRSTSKTIGIGSPWADSENGSGAWDE